jgi:2,3-bisphosphoglycerate-dependent phosphoglycerate mutase
MGVPRELDYDVEWPVPEFVGLSVAQALAMAGETGIELVDAGDSMPQTGRSHGRIVRQTPQGPERRRPTTVTVWVVS